jgi:hypothetical protein
MLLIDVVVSGCCDDEKLWIDEKCFGAGRVARMITWKASKVNAVCQRVSLDDLRDVDISFQGHELR